MYNKIFRFYRRNSFVTIIFQKDVLSDLDSLVQLTNSLMSNPNTKPSIIILDAINQVSTCSTKNVSEVGSSNSFTIALWTPVFQKTQIYCNIPQSQEAQAHVLRRFTIEFLPLKLLKSI